MELSAFSLLIGGQRQPCLEYKTAFLIGGYGGHVFLEEGRVKSSFFSFPAPQSTTRSESVDLLS